MIDLQRLAGRFVRRARALSLSGGRRDLECRAFYEGAAAALELAGLGPEAKLVADQAALVIAPCGFAGAVHLAIEARPVLHKPKDLT